MIAPSRINLAFELNKKSPTSVKKKTTHEVDTIEIPLNPERTATVYITTIESSTEIVNAVELLIPKTFESAEDSKGVATEKVVLVASSKARIEIISITLPCHLSTLSPRTGRQASLIF